MITTAQLTNLIDNAAMMADRAQAKARASGRERDADLYREARHHAEQIRQTSHEGEIWHHFYMVRRAEERMS
jgi:hypothetical protein